MKLSLILTFAHNSGRIYTLCIDILANIKGVKIMLMLLRSIELSMILIFLCTLNMLILTIGRHGERVYERGGIVANRRVHINDVDIYRRSSYN